jgi:hypothetical protein
MKYLVITILTFFITSISFATNYYIDVFSGNDSNTGTSPEKAWKTIGRVNSATLIPGDSVLFKRGEVFRGNLIPANGSMSGNITYADYGTGNKPKLLGSIQKNNPSDWIDEGGNIWSTSKKEIADTIPTINKELLPNPDFVAGTVNWYCWNNTSNGASSQFSETNNPNEYFTSPGGGKLQCISQGITNADIQLWTSTITINSGRWYKLIFKAKASSQFIIPSGNIKLMQNPSPYTSYSSSVSKTEIITTSWRTFELFYKSNATANDVRINFMLGNAIPGNTTFYIDSLSFKELERDPGFIMVDVGNIVFNDESFCGKKVKSDTLLKNQGDFWYDQDNNSLKLYSVSNPSSIYSNIEIALNQHIINENGKSYITYLNLDLRYGGAHGIGGGNTSHITIKNLDISWIGGGYLAGYGDGQVRYGNGIEFWTSAHDNIIESCTFNQIYDAALTSQGNGATYEAYNLYFINNIVSNSEYSFEFWGDPSTTFLHDIYFENNTCLYAGFGWGHIQRPDPNGAHLMFWGYNKEKMKNIFIRNNIFYESSDYGSRYDQLSTLYKFTVDYNCWYESSGALAIIAGKKYDYLNQWKEYQNSSGMDSHSIFTDPLLNTTYSLSDHSPCIDAGIESPFVTDDFNHTIRPQEEKYDIGAFESISSSSITDKVTIDGINLFPNPAYKKLEIETPDGFELGTISFIDVNGREMLQIPISDHKKEVDISQLPRGLFIVKIRGKQSILVKKITKE